MNGWIFPSFKKDEIFSILASKIDVKTVSGEIEKENALEIKNAVDVESSIIVNGVESKVENIESGEDGPVYTTTIDNKEVEVTEKEVAIVPAKSEEFSSIVNEVNEENRFKTGKELFGKEAGEESVAEKIENNTTSKEAQLKDFITKSGETINALDYSHIKFSDIQLVEQSTILDKPRPSWCPEINEKYFSGYKDDKFVFDYIKLDDDRIILAVNGYTFKDDGSKDSFYSNINNKNQDAANDYAVVSLDQLVAVSDYYTKKRKQQIIVEKENGIIAKLEWVRKQPDSVLDSYKAFSYTRLSEKQKKKYTQSEWDALDKESKINEIPFMRSPVVALPVSRRVKQLDDDTMYRSNFRMYKKFTDKNYVVPTGRFSSSDPCAKEYQEIREAIKWKKKDLEIQREENSASYEKGFETSYGDSNTKNDLLDSHGVKIKTQNGKELKADQIEQIKSNLNEVYSSFGNRSEMSKNFGLKISHAGDKRMFARKALGIYIPSLRAIGVSDDKDMGKFGFTLAHEYSHFIDNYLGKKSGRHFASDDYNSLAGKIATTFRSNMNFKSESDYINRTCECFARAFEQYHAMKHYGEDVVKYKINGVQYHQDPNHVNKEKFNTLIKPLIDQFLNENNDLLKSAFNTLGIC